MAGAGLGDPELDEVEALPPKILNMTVPQVGHFPLIALRPFFITSSTASTISFFALHLTQYPSGIRFSCPRFMREPVIENSLGGADNHRQLGKGFYAPNRLESNT